MKNIMEWLNNVLANMRSGNQQNEEKDASSSAPGHPEPPQSPVVRSSVALLDGERKVKLIRFGGIGAGIVLLAMSGFYIYNSGLLGNGFSKSNDVQTQPFADQSTQDQASLSFSSDKKEHYWESALDDDTRKLDEADEKVVLPSDIQSDIERTVGEQAPLQDNAFRPYEETAIKVDSGDKNLLSAQPVATDGTQSGPETGVGIPQFVDMPELFATAEITVPLDTVGNDVVVTSELEEHMLSVERLLQVISAQLLETGKHLKSVEKPHIDVVERLTEIKRSLEKTNNSLGGLLEWAQKSKIRPGWKLIAATKKQVVIVSPDGKHERIRVGQVISRIPGR